MNIRRDIDAEFGIYAMRASRSLTAWPHGIVYVVGAGPEYRHVKIGRTSGDVRKRLVGLQTSSALPLRVLFVMRGGIDLERELHARFAGQRERGEWFRFEGDVACFVTYCLAYQALRDGRAA